MVDLQLLIATAVIAAALQAPRPGVRPAPRRGVPATSAAPAALGVGDFDVADWRRAYASARGWPAAPVAAPVYAGSVPEALRGGTLYRVGPGNFERGGARFAHVLDGDGFVVRVHFDDGGGVSASARFVRTPAFDAEEAADAVLYRNTFGTRPRGPWWLRAGDVSLKNVANTNCVHWGDRGDLLALWEAGAPFALDPETLETRGEALDLVGGSRARVRGVTVDARVDAVLGVGSAFTAHPHVVGDRLAYFTWAQAPLADELRLAFREVDDEWREVNAVSGKHPFNFTST